ncbi:hypothetical protein AVEN_148077-1 [Araneus ventricosus]|uniref:Uncharacterized protein n=1 Tax=Araneus ventricosus TaxID=182803 RepID=A0A4Y2J4W8_ARAVE|nr:hypothetical protein AVEN_272028-1 [Araneus ventricosus]GBM84975.1 hypothetical protein AVEN_17859-1 [Araneus ventricosus]GBM84978.1 hypothetical protein AVEN_26648-1 [Araneus ventricosus]GBM85000.1 hypothetical protein AVEN_148077-1 [Araneus ventricosus]
MNTNTELLGDTLDEIFEETDSEGYNENETEELETEVSEDAERSDDGDLKKKKNLFEGNPGSGILTVFCHTRKFDRQAERRFTSNYSEERPAHDVQLSHLFVRSELRSD